MVEELYFYRLLIILAGVLSLILSIFSYFKLNNAPGARHYMFVTFLSAIFTFSYAFELASSNLKEIKFWLGVEYLVMPFIPGFILLMCFEYVGIKLRQRHIFILFGIPLITVFMHHTNELHRLYYASVGLLADAPFPIVHLEYGPFFYLHSLYLFICMTVSIIVLLLQLKKSLIQFRVQLMTMVAGLLVPIIANSFYLNDLSPYGIDLGPVSMSISFTLHGIALFSFQMFNVVPIARERVFDNMLEGVIVLDQSGHIVDFNKAILRVIPMLSTFSIGKSAHQFLAKNKKLAELISRSEECEYEQKVGTKIEHYQVRFSKVLNRKGVPISIIITFVDITEIVEMQRKLKELANFDGLTKIYNRRYFMDQSATILESIEKNAYVIMFDIDHFKIINDTYGHETGDIVLTQVAQLAKRRLRSQDIIGRYGGEEFVILLPEIELKESIELANAIRLTITEALITTNNNSINVTASFGLAPIEITPLDKGDIFKQALRNADQALYTAKRNGRNTVQAYTEEMQLV
ncbi:histidine kinase N-terminal 7TM domain-containing protein [Lysinibacillus sp. SGAir0095]|uniref:histidine kinase N-terminal 7TM domain-containing diguanylate cyclase n=1 Tax=Lysinibacillus sp. SGAir0095 TaxID=2070463 RepID=UPI0010CD681F|nr:histidine kinase N-terminal 7TM domain-containing protein [Lysinibacillus sp. SGAir0095]QCR32226.1 sensor domain-containing diguanylate cyclase [Lysinibacillus sp. SGAir0095]